MILSDIPSQPTWYLFYSQPIFQKSLAWISENHASVADGVHQLGEPGWRVNVHSYATRTIDQCIWENHRRTIDLQYIISGAEGIRMLPISRLGTPYAYDEDADEELFDPSEASCHILSLQKGESVVFFPGEVHSPGLALGEGGQVRKLVVKIPITPTQLDGNRAR